MRAFTSRRRALLATLYALAALLLAVPATAAACGTEAPPVITNAKLSPTSLPWEGGTVRIEGDVASDCGVKVWMEITSTEGGYFPSELAVTEETVNDNPRTYRAEFSPPPNYQEWGVSYQVTLWAEDVGGGTEQAYPGEFEVAPSPNFDEAPYVSNAAIGPSSLGTEGGWVTISADISDNRGVAYAFANIMLPDETLKEVVLEPVSSSHFVGHYKAPANYGTAPQQYSVTAYGQDDIGQLGYESAGTFTVAGRPGPLSFEIERGGSIGNVTVGRTATRLVTVHNSAAKWLKASLTVAGSPWFALRNAVGATIEFSVGPGGSRRFWLDVTPTAVGPATGSLTLTRADGAQPPSVRKLSVAGVPPAS